MKKFRWWIIAGAVFVAVMAFLLGRYALPNNALPPLPKPELAEGERGELGIDKNINEATIDKYLGRSDAVYRDVRMLVDPGNYGAIGGDSYLSGFVDGFEVVPLPYLVNVKGLPEAVGETYSGNTLFTNNGDGTYTANYVESMQILEDLFPRDKVIFLMCGGGGYSGMLRQMLIALGWDESKIYDVGGYWFYDGEHNVEVSRELADGTTVYDFYKVPYHEIDFDKLNKWASGELVKITASMYDKMIEEKKTFVVFVDQDACTTADTLREYVKKWSDETGQLVYRMMFTEMRKSSLYESVKYFPSVAIITNGEVSKWLNTDSDEDKDKFSSYDSFKSWISEK